jgi:hypothetical protein
VAAGAAGPEDDTLIKDSGQGRAQVRQYGPDGKLVRDIDWGHGGPQHGDAPDPHIHQWQKPSSQAPNPVRGPGLDPGDLHGPGF